MNPHGPAFREHVATATALLADPVRMLSPSRFSTPDYIAALREVEDLGRLVDAARAALAGNAGNRTGGPVNHLGALGYASPVDAVATLTGISDRDAKRRIRTGTALMGEVSLTGAETGPNHPIVASAVLDGTLGTDAAMVLIDALNGVSPRVNPVIVAEAEEALVHLAAGTTDHPPLRVDLVRGQAQVFVDAIDPDGTRPREERARRRRRFTIGPETIDGLIPVHGLLTLDVGVTLRRLIDAHIRKVTFTGPTSREPFGAGAPDSGPDGTPPSGTVDTSLTVDPFHTDTFHPVDTFHTPDDRTPAQRRHDTLADILSAASRVKDAPEIAGTAPAITVTVTQTALDAGRGVGSIDGVDTPISIHAIEKLIDSRGTQTVTMNQQGRILSLGSVQRCFTPSQRRAITARDGGCVIPGCTTPAGWCEIHHVTPWRDGGPTHTDNGVLLCWGHHQNIDSGPWRLSMPDGVPHVRGPGHREWTHTTKNRTQPPDSTRTDTRHPFPLTG